MNSERWVDYALKAALTDRHCHLLERASAEAIPLWLIGTQLAGYVCGAFTGATQ